ncbi:hypothetical protein FLONG3_3269 [Fusarium longipes]|uniref:Uncharacterized protein n=1 Tax=Fusarium longipes TaxID=694270 RepID=A0A395T2B0_9HYPO|nr:hypothetical protein FLONG3_3269 [Fusarium longipes]
MLCNNILLVTGALMATVTAAPTAHHEVEARTAEAEPGVSPIDNPLIARANKKIAWGEQIQNGDESNYWVAWIEGEHACPGDSVIVNKSENICGRLFTLAGLQLSFTACGTTGEPNTVISGSSGYEYGHCGPNGKNGRKINCPKGSHDIKQHGYCK